MKFAISVPDDLFQRADGRATELGVSRSAFYATAASRYLDDLDTDRITEQINSAIDHDTDQQERLDWAHASTARLANLDDDEW